MKYIMELGNPTLLVAWHGYDKKAATIQELLQWNW
jgi:hypothetical protein